MASNPPRYIDPASNVDFTPITSPAEKRKARREDVSTTGTQTSTAINAAELPYVAPKKQADLTDAQLKILRDLQANAREDLKTFEGLEVVKTYDQGMRYFVTALNVPSGRAGDQDLVTLAAKVQDPTGAVMQGDISRYSDIQTALEVLPQWFRDQFAQGGKFSPETRQKIVAFMRNRMDTYRLPYAEARKNFEQRIGGFNEQLAPLGVTPVEVEQILPGDPLELYAPKIADYDRKQEAERIRAQREAGAPRADVFQGPPEGAEFSPGADVTGFRFTPESEAKMLAYARDPNATPEGYGALGASLAIAEGFAPPEQEASMAQGLASASQDFFKQPPESRGRAQALDYSQIDRAASENAGLFQSVAQGVMNVPESAAQMATGLSALPRDVTLSLLTGERAGSVKTMTDLASALVQGDTNDPTVRATAQMLEDRYGSLDALQRSAITDPVGILGDLSMVLTGGGTVAARAPGMVGRFGEGMATVGRVIDPLSAATGFVTEGIPAGYQAAKARMPGTFTGIENAPSELVGLPSGIGGQAVREGVGAGFERGVTGAPTARSEAFTEGMRKPGESAESLVQTARDAIGGLREAAGNKYRTAMQQFGQNPVPLDISVLQQRMARIKPRNYDAMVDAPRRPSDHIAWQQMNDTVEHYSQQALSDPSLLEPLALDAFKQDLYDIGSKIGGAFDRDAARIAKTAYTAVRQELVKHDPLYADIMRDYEKAAVEARELEDTFSLGQARGKPIKVDAAARKLQSLMRNNAFTNYGMRAQQGERLAELDPTGTLLASTAGQMASAPTARGITRGVVAGGSVPGAGVLAALNPATLLATVPLLTATSPRVTGELAYGVGRAAGTGKRALDTIAASPVGTGLGDIAGGLADLYQKYPMAGLALAQAGSRAQETEAERLQRQYGSNAPPMVMSDGQASFAPAQAAPAQAAPSDGTLMINGRRVRYDPATDMMIDVETGEPVEGYARGGRIFRRGI